VPRCQGRERGSRSVKESGVDGAGNGAAGSGGGRAVESVMRDWAGSHRQGGRRGVVRVGKGATARSRW